MSVYCVMNDEGALITIYRNREDAEQDAMHQRKYGWYVVERYVF